MRLTSAILIVAIVCKSNARELNSVLQGDKEYNEVNSETTADSFNCTPNLLTLRFPENTVEPNITWELVPSTDKCSYEFRINLTEISATDTNVLPISEKVNTTFYYLNDIKPCTRYNVSVDVFEKDKPEILATITDIFNSTIMPDKVNTLHLQLNSSHTEISWMPPHNQDCIKEYNVIIGNDLHITKTSNITIPKNSYCSEIRIEAVTYDNQSGEAVTVNKPGPVQTIKASANSSSLVVTWGKPIEESCVADYVIQLGDIEEYSTNRTEYTFSEVKACETYAIRVAARTADGIVGDFQNYSITIPAPEVLGPVTYYNKEEEENFVNVSWQPPENTGSCSIIYILKVSDDHDSEIFNGSTTSSSYNITTQSFIGCRDYNISIVPSTNSFEGIPVKLPLRLTKVTQPPTCEVKNVSKTDALLECIVDSYTSNKCDIEELSVKCQPNNQEKQVIQKANTSVFVYDNESKQAITVQSLSEFTNYTCTGIVKNSAGESLESKPIAFQTDEGEPDPPKLGNITSITSTSFSITWDPPEQIRGTLRKYVVTIDSHGPLYFLPSNCEEQGNTTYTNETLPDVTEFSFVEGYAKYNYTVNVIACTESCSLPSETKEIITEGAIPAEPPQDVYSNITTIDEDYNATVDVFWIHPCYTNGIPKRFEVGIWGKPTVDNVEDHTDSTIVPVVDEMLNYTCTFSKLPPAFEYVIKVKVVTAEDSSSDSGNTTFNSTEGVPEAPADFKTSLIADGTFVAEWSKPSRQNGVLQNYSVHVVDLGPSYEVFEVEDCPKDNKTDIFEVLPEQTNFTFVNGQSYYEYETWVVACTIVGCGTKSKIDRFNTLDTVPDKVHNLNYDIDNQYTEEYEVSVIVSFDHPCRTNGPFRNISVKLEGTRPNYEPNVTHHFTDTAKQSYTFTIGLLAEYTYTVNVQVENENYTSEISEKIFSSPSGVPPNITDITAPVANIQDEAVYSVYNLSSDLFDHINGEILYYSVILGEQNHEEESKYGFWEADDDQSWPIVGSDLKADWIQPYEATPKYWNPFKDSSSTSYIIVLGNTTLWESNKLLQLDVRYTFKIRAFTWHGYRDSPTVKFYLPVPEEVAQLGLILGLIFGILATAIVLAVVFILWRRRQQWAMKKESIKSIPLTPMPISIKQFPEYYSELKENSDRLKHEYMLLGNQSCEVTLPAYDGMLPENKKKNRYTNIIPYDQTRVKLVDTNDNYSYSDYINASYIQGYSNTTEYIATQGPLEHTCMDFWKMIIQENVSLIVMVAQFVEQNKEKCFKYFPDNHENMELENGIAIRCSTELSFKSYSVRTLLVQKDLKQWTVTHLQFTEWPDFGCPTGTEVMLEFCHLMREYAERNPDPIVIHCSAGVGRTGTLIALDIILQIIKNKQDIDVFGTVLNLRRDRRNMVQTEKQYLYIHNCISDAIENPSSIKNEHIANDPIYENLDYIKEDLYANIKENDNIKMNEDDTTNKENENDNIKENIDLDIKESQF